MQDCILGICPRIMIIVQGDNSTRQIILCGNRPFWTSYDRESMSLMLSSCSIY